MTPAADRRPPSAARAVAGNALAQTAGKVVVLGVGAASIAVTTRYLGAAGYGRFALALALLQSVGVLADAGLTTVVVREGSRTPARLAELIGNALAIRLVLAPVVVALAVVLASVPGYGPEVATAVLIAAVPFVMGIVSSSLAAAFQVRLQMGRAALADALGRVASFGALLAVVAGDLGFEAVVASMAVGAAVTLAVTATFALRAVRVRLAVDREVWRELAVAALPLGLTLAVAELYFRADTFILSLSRSAADVGHYTLAYRIYELLALIPAVVMTTVFPLLSRQDRRSGGAHPARHRAGVLDARRADRRRRARDRAGARAVRGRRRVRRRRRSIAAAAVRGGAGLPVGAVRLRADRRQPAALDPVALAGRSGRQRGAQRRAGAGVRTRQRPPRSRCAPRGSCSPADGCSCTAASGCARPRTSRFRR